MTGTPAASPADPASPANFLPLARVRVNAGASTLGTITDLRPRLGSPYHAEVYRNAALSIANGFAFVTIAYDSLETSGDPNGNFNTGTGVYTCPLSGLYRVTAYALFSAGGTGTIGLSISKNGGTDSKRIGAGYNTANIGTSGSGKIRCASGDTLAVQVAQSTASNPAALFTGSTFLWATFELVGP